MSTESWDEPVKCAKLIERFTSHNLSDAVSFNLKDYSRNDLEGIIQMLHGFYTSFMLDNSVEVLENIKCSVDDVLTSISLASSIHPNEEGELILSDELWGIVKHSPQLLKLLMRVEVS